MASFVHYISESAIRLFSSNFYKLSGKIKTIFSEANAQERDMPKNIETEKNLDTGLRSYCI